MHYRVKYIREFDNGKVRWIYTGLMTKCNAEKIMRNLKLSIFESFAKAYASLEVYYDDDGKSLEN